MPPRKKNETKNGNFEEEVVLEFYTLFGWFEHALKSTGFSKAGRNHRNAQADWEGFARQIEASFDADATPELEAAVLWMLGRPIKRRIRREGQALSPGESAHRQSDMVWLSGLIWETGKNLLHGVNLQSSHSCDLESIYASLLILEAWAECDPKVGVRRNGQTTRTHDEIQP